MGTPYKMKGSPMARNFGISPMKQDKKKKDISNHNENAYYEAKSIIEKEANKPGLNMAKLIRKTKAGIKLTEEEKTFANNYAKKKAAEKEE